MTGNFKKIILLSLSAVMLSGCGLSTLGEESSQTESETKTVSSRKYIQTTKTMSKEIAADEDDIDGYTTTQEVTGSLENSFSMEDEPDEDILATMTTTTTLYTVPEGAQIKTTAKTSKTSKKTSETKPVTTTKFKADSLYKPADKDLLGKKVKYKVVSDTTFLNLRFGPSKKYEIQLKIPDGEYVYGTAITSNPDDKDEKWVFVSYNGTGGWVMNGLLSKE